MKLARGAAAAALGVVVTFAGSARAQDSLHDKAVAAFQEGRRYIEAGNCDGAITKLRESLSFEPSVGARLSIAECYEKTEPLAAWRMLKDAANLAYLNHDERLPLAEERAAALEKRLPTLHVVIPRDALEQPGFELRVDGELIDRFHYRSGIIATTAGKHLVEASAPLRHFSERVVVELGASTQVAVRLEHDTCPTTPPAVTSAPAAVERAREDAGSTRRTLGLAVAGVGVAGLASGVVFGIVTLGTKSHIEELCGGNAGSCNAPAGSVEPERESATTTATISTTSFIAGGLALIGGGLLYFTAPSRTATAQVRLSPRAATTGGSLGLEGTF